jgi:hypothetical protein
MGRRTTVLEALYNQCYACWIGSMFDESTFSTRLVVVWRYPRVITLIVTAHVVMRPPFNDVRRILLGVDERI